MKLRSITMRNFRSFADSTITLGEKVTVVVGMNDAGKSTILDAISVVLTGTARGSEAGVGLGELVRRGYRDFEILSDVQFAPDEEPVTISRNSQAGARAGIQKAIEQRSGASKEAIRACLWAGEILRLPKKEAAKIILDASQVLVQITDEYLAVAARAAELGLTGYIVAEQEAGAPLAAIEQAYRTAYDQRRLLRKQLEEWNTPEAEAPGILGEMSKVFGCEGADLVAALTEAESSQRDEVVAIEVEIRKAAKSESLRDPKRIPELEKGIQYARDMLSKLPPAPMVDHRARREELLSGRGDWQAKKAGYEAELKAATAALDGHKKTLANMTGTSETCPTCGKKLTAKEAGERRASVNDLVRLTESNMAVLRGAIKKADDALAKIVKDANDHLLEAEAADDVKEKRATYERNIREQEAQLAELTGYQGPVFDTVAAQTRLRTETETLRGLSAALDEIRTYYANVEAVGKAQKKLRVLREKVELIDRLVAMLGPNGLRQGAGEQVGSFLESLNEVLRGLGMGVDLNPLLQGKDDPLVSLAGSQPVPARLLSRSGMIRFSLGFQTAIAKSTGVGVVVVDDMDALDQENTDLVLDLAGTITDAGVQVILLKVPRADWADTVAWFQSVEAEPGWQYLLIDRTEAGVEVHQS